MARAALAAAAAVAIASAIASAQPAYDPGLAMNAVYYSAAAYCGGSSLTTWTCAACTAPGNNALPLTSVVSLYNKSETQFGYVGVQEGTNTGVISFRGSRTVTNWIVNFEFILTPYPGCAGCELHDGFYRDDYLGVAEQLLAALDGLGYNTTHVPPTLPEDGSLFLTGHSLGAAVSEIAVFELLLAGYPVGGFVTFGDPRVGNAAWAQAYETAVGWGNNSAAGGGSAGVVSSHIAGAAAREAALDAVEAAIASEQAASGRGKGLPVSPILRRAVERRAARRAAGVGAELPAAGLPLGSWRVVNAADPVPHLPPELFGFKHPAREVWYPTSGQTTTYDVCSASNGEDPKCSDSVLLPAVVSDHLDYLGVHLSDFC